jgi:polar amino acid transport system substrate-binding protein
MKRFKAFRPAALLLCTAGALSSFSAQAFQQPGKITAGSDMTFFPYEYMENNKPAGFDIEFLAGLAKTMGREAVNIDTRFPNLIPGLQGGRFDITNSSMYITAERLKVIDMVPYLKSGEAILALKGSDYQPKTPEDFAGIKSARWAPPRGWRSCKSSPPTTA